MTQTQNDRDLYRKVITRRAAMLTATGNESAALCATTALQCLDRYLVDAPYTGSHGETWAHSALAWCSKGAQHAWGWERSWPAGW